MADIAVVFKNESDVKVSEKLLKDTCSLILRRQNRLGRVEIELIVVGDNKIKTLNKQYRQTDEATDVLSFPAAKAAEENSDFLGSVVISVDTATKQANQAGITLEKELQMLTGHGFLHLIGYHHN